VSERSNLEIIEERLMVEVPRGRDAREVLRVQFVRAKTPEGKEVAWHSVREFYRADDGTMRPGKSGVTIRARELSVVAIALLRAVASSVPNELHASAKAIIAALERAQTAARAPSLRPANPNMPRPDELPSDYYARRRGGGRP
jgi:hypothetical protein